MTRQEATDEAHCKFGVGAKVSRVSWWANGYQHGTYYLITVGHGMRPVEVGRGTSWEAAFADADRRTGKGDE